MYGDILWILFGFLWLIMRFFCCVFCFQLFLENAAALFCVRSPRIIHWTSAFHRHEGEQITLNQHFACVTAKRCLATHFWREATQVITLIARTDLFHRYINNSCFSWNTTACGKHFNHLGLSWTLIRVLIWRLCSQPHSVCEQPDRGAVAGLDRWLSVKTFALTELKRWSSSGLTARMFEE